MNTIAVSESVVINQMLVKHVQMNVQHLTMYIMVISFHILCLSFLKQQGVVSRISLNVSVDTASQCPLFVITGMTVETTVMSKTVVGSTIHLDYSTKAAWVTKDNILGSKCGCPKYTLGH